MMNKLVKVMMSVRTATSRSWHITHYTDNGLLYNRHDPLFIQ